jgi:gliding motility-associated-like protein
MLNITEDCEDGGGNPMDCAATATVTAEPCAEDGTLGAATITATGGNGTYLYSWADGTLGATRTDLSSGTYVVTVTDGNGCNTTATVALTDDCEDGGNNGSECAATASVISQPCTTNGVFGSASVTATGGNGDYTFEWSDGILGQTRSDLISDVYTITVTDTEGCETQTTVTLTDDCPDTDNPCDDYDVFVETTADFTLEDCGETASLCIEGIHMNDIVNYTITDNGEIISDFTGCNYDIALNYYYYPLTSIAPTGPYAINWSVNGEEFNGTVQNLEEIVAFMNANDNTSSWVLDADELNFDGGNTSTTYGNINFVQQGTNIMASLVLGTVQTPNGTSINLGEGTHAIVITNAENCSDEITVTVTCEDNGGGNTGGGDPILTETETIDLSVLPGTSDEVCVDVSELNGNIVSVTNGCAEESGNTIDFTFTGTETCVDFTAIDFGSESGCIVVCDDAGTCDTTLVNITVLQPTPEVIDLTMIVSESDVICVDTTQLGGTIVSITNTCEEQSGEIATFTLDGFCVDIEAIEEGTATACIVICDDLGYCDTTTINVNVNLAEGGTGGLIPPVAIDDNRSTAIETSIDIETMDNDTINGTLIDYGIVTNPENGTVDLDETGSFIYTPDDEFCGEEDNFTYFIANEVGQDTATVTVLVTCEDLTIFSGFSPNGDGVNDVFTILGIENFPNSELLMFNRWGNQVLSAKGYRNDWDGTWDGQILPDGTYFYVLDDGEGNKYSGYVQINR